MLTRKMKIIGIPVAVLVILVIIFSLTRGTKTEYVTAKVEKGKIVQTVGETGVVKAAQELSLNFLNSGRVAKILVKTGDKIKKDQVLAELDYTALSIQEKEAEANLNKLLRGATQAEIAVTVANEQKAKTAYLAAVSELNKVQNTVAENISQAQKTLNDLESTSPNNVTTYEKAVEVAQTSLNNTKSTYSQAITSKENSALNTVESKISVANTALDIIKTVITRDDAVNLLSAKDTSYLANTQITYDSAVSLFSVAGYSLGIAKSSKTESNINKSLADASLLLSKTFDSLSFCFKALENSVTSASTLLYTEAELATDKASISTQITNLSSAISSVQTADQDLKDARLSYSTKTSDAEAALSKAKVDLDNAKINALNALNSATISGDQQIASAEAQVNNAKRSWEVASAEVIRIKSPARSEDIVLAQTALDSVKDRIENSIIKAPIDGTVTAVNYEIGEQTSASEPAVSILGVNNFAIEVDISEADIAKINLNNLAEITLDAFGDEVKFRGEVYFIEPAETVIQDVIYYRVKINFEIPENYNIKSGMTANVIITTAQKDNVLIIPTRAIVQKSDQGKIVRVLVKEKIYEMPVTTGLRGDGGMVEILSGVKEGDEVVTFIKEGK